MKRLAAAGILLLLLAGICTAGIWTIDHNYTKIDALLAQAVDLYEAGDMEQAADFAVELEKQWVKAERYLSIFVNHATVDEVGASIGKLEPLALTGDEAGYLAACKTARLQLQHIRSNEEVSFLNVF